MRQQLLSLQHQSVEPFFNRLPHRAPDESGAGNDLRFPLLQSRPGPFDEQGKAIVLEQNVTRSRA